MKDLRPLLFPVTITSSDTACPPVTAVRVVTIGKCEENLHEVVPDGVFRDESVVSQGLLDYGREVAAPTVLHENIEYACISVNMSIVVAYDVFVVEVLQDIT